MAEALTNPPSIAKRAAFVGVLVCFGLFLGGLALEMFFRLALDIYECDDDLGWVFKPDKFGLKISRHGEFFQVVRFNSDGFRDEDWTLEKPRNTFRVALMGDSFAAGLQVPTHDLFARQIEGSLNQVLADDSRVEILNAAVDGYGTAQQLLLYRQKLRSYKPDLVLLAVYPGNDLADNWPGSGNDHYIARQCGRPYYRLVDGELVDLGLVKPATRSGSTADRLFGFLRIYANFAPQTYQESDFTLADIKQRQHPDTLDRAWALTKRLILEFDQDVRGDGGRLAVMILPDPFSFSKWRFRDLPRVERLAELRQTWPIETLLEDFLIHNGVQHINLMRPLAAANVVDIQALFIPRDYHFNILGHEKVAEILHNWIVEEAVLEPSTAAAMF
jgi:hypothetical protein